jgi:protoheme IX farnesyltransferase
MSVALAGYLMAGGANAINMWFDRDIDKRMSRTRLRPVPTGRVAPPVALAFGIGLAAVAFCLFWRLVNSLSAWLALAGLAWYVLVYTMWLKRSSPRNIVIGGAAGAFPVLVGWAAVTGHLDLTAVYLFAIIFFWTPPHFWALALVKRREYARSGVPMLPVVRGEQRTRLEMLIYTLLLIPLTLMPAAFGAFGWLYAVSAGLLDAVFLWYCLRLWTPTATPRAWQLYRYSLLYLFLLFLAMPIDRHIAPALHRGPSDMQHDR